MALASKGGLTRREVVQANALLKHLDSKGESEPFRVPVDYYAMGLADYPRVIRKPMDLSTVQRKVTAGKYKTFKDFLADLKLIWDNCRMYNKLKSPIHLSATVMEAYTADFLENYVDPEEQQVSRVESMRISLDEKVELISQLRELPLPLMVQAVELVESESPRAVEKLESGRTRLWVDQMSRVAFTKLQALLRDNVTEAEKEPVKKAKRTE